jgi:hypothetical protein
MQEAEKFTAKEHQKASARLAPSMLDTDEG